VWTRPRPTGGGSFGFRFPSSQTVNALLAANITVFILQLLMRGSLEFGFLQTFGLVPAKVLPQFHLWQFGTYMFLHGGFWHLAFNMFALWMFGAEIENYWGRRTFLNYYFVCGLGGGLIYTLTSWGSPVPLVGASGAIFGLLLAYGMMFPDRQILLYFLFPIKAKYFVMILGAINLLSAMQPNMDNVGYFAHLGGMLFGYLYLKGGLGPGLALPRAGGLKEAWHRRRMRSKMRVVSPGQRSDDGGEVDTERVNAILEKISREGLQSLTAEEEDILRRASRKH
jgi:membrane associated rhomboid family serine protease